MPTEGESGFGKFDQYSSIPKAVREDWLSLCGILRDRKQAEVGGAYFTRKLAETLSAQHQGVPAEGPYVDFGNTIKNPLVTLRRYENRRIELIKNR